MASSGEAVLFPTITCEAAAIAHAARRKANCKGLVFGKSVPKRQYTRENPAADQQYCTGVRGQSGHALLDCKHRATPPLPVVVAAVNFQESRSDT
jgi:hypothetical protein